MKEITMTEEVTDLIADAFHHFGNAVKEITLREDDEGEVTVVITIKLIDES